MGPGLRCVLAIAAICLAAGAARADDDAVPYRALKPADFTGETPPDDQRMKDGVTLNAESAVGINSHYDVTTGPGDKVVLTAAKFTAEFDPAASWLDPALSAAEKQRILKHEQGHFDITESAALRLKAETAQITKEINDALSGDPAFRQAIIDTLADAAHFQSRIDSLEAQLKTTVDPAKKKELEDDLAAQRQGLADSQDSYVTQLEDKSPTAKRILADEDKTQTAYDDDTKHSTVEAQQTIWNKRIQDLVTDATKKTPAAESSARHSLHFDAGTGTLSFTDDQIFGVEGAAGDPITGASVLLPELQLTGLTAFDAPLFTAPDPDFRIVVPDGTVLFTGALPELFYLPGDNRLLGYIEDPAVIGGDAFASPWLDILRDQLAKEGLLVIELRPDAPLGDFTADADVPFENLLYVGTLPVSEPAGVLVLLSGLSVLAAIGRRARLAPARRPSATAKTGVATTCNRSWLAFLNTVRTERFAQVLALQPAIRKITEVA